MVGGLVEMLVGLVGERMGKAQGGVRDCAELAHVIIGD